MALTQSEALRLIADLSAGWDEHGSTGPREPLSWETVARLSMDYARAAVAPVTRVHKACQRHEGASFTMTVGVAHAAIPVCMACEAEAAK